jgi:adenylate cyclase
MTLFLCSLCFFLPILFYMPVEIERKFLVKNDTWRSEAVGIDYCQGYLSRKPEAVVRVRIEGKNSFLTIKGRSQGISRPEFEYQIPIKEALELQQLCTTPLVKKTRYLIPYDGMIWEVDEFMGENEGLIIAEIELDHPEALITLPPWVGVEVSHDRRYCNSHLATHPFKSW